MFFINNRGPNSRNVTFLTKPEINRKINTDFTEILRINTDFTEILRINTDFDSFDNFVKTPTVLGLKNTVLSVTFCQKPRFVRKPVFIDPCLLTLDMSMFSRVVLFPKGAWWTSQDCRRRVHHGRRGSGDGGTGWGGYPGNGYGATVRTTVVHRAHPPGIPGVPFY